MDAKELAAPFKRNLYVLEQQVAGLSHADSLLQPQPRGNCLNFIIGHILIGRDNVLAMLGQEKLLTEAEKARYDTDTDPITADGEGVLPLERLLELMRESTQRIEDSLAGMSAEALAQEVPQGDSTRPLSAVVAFFGWHDTYHIGQTEFLRQLAGTDDKVI